MTYFSVVIFITSFQSVQMESFDRKAHWEQIYQTKNLHEVSWYQPVPETSLQVFKTLHIPADAAIIDVGGGDSLLADHLLHLGYRNITVLDISAKALERAKARLGSDAHRIKWIVADAASFIPEEKYDVWHDRAAFHFLTDEQDVNRYLNTAQQHLKPDGILIVGTFSEAGPKKCSGIDIKQYSEAAMTELMKTYFEKIRCFSSEHETPAGHIQQFLFCLFRKKALSPL